MPELNHIKFLLNIQDPHIELLGVGETVDRKQQVSRYAHARLGYEAPVCACGTRMQKWSFTHTKLQTLSVAGYPLSLHIDKQRFHCPNCGKNCLAQSPDLDSAYSISRSLKFKILELLRKKISMTVIAEILEVSIPTVQRVLDTVSLRPLSDLLIMCPFL